MARTPAPTRRDPPDIQWLERMYNNRMRVPDHGDYFARWAAQSAMVRRSLPCQLDVHYCDGPRQREDAMTLSTASNFIDPDTAYRLVVEAHRGLRDEDSALLDTALVLILANHIGDAEVLREAISLAKRQLSQNKTTSEKDAR